MDQLPLPPDLASFLTFIATPIFAAWIVSHFIETIPQWADLAATVKQAIMLAIYIGLGLLSYALVKWVPADVIVTLQPIYAVIIGAITAWISANLWHGAIAPAGKLIQAKARFALIGQTTKQEAIPPKEKVLG